MRAIKVNSLRYVVVLSGFGEPVEVFQDGGKACQVRVFLKHRNKTYIQRTIQISVMPERIWNVLCLCIPACMLWEDYGVTGV